MKIKITLFSIDCITIQEKGVKNNNRTNHVYLTWVSLLCYYLTSSLAACSFMSGVWS